MNDQNRRSLRFTIFGMAVLYVMTFVGGFLQATPYNFVNYVFFFLLFVGGICLMRTTINAKATGATSGFLFLTGLSAALLFLFFCVYEWFRLQGDRNLEASIEALLYWLTLFFWIGVIGSLVLLWRSKGGNATA